MPRFSPDGCYLAFTSGKSPQLYLLDMGGGGAIPATDFEDGISQYEWLPDSTGFVVTAVVRPQDQQDADEDELKRRPRRLTQLDYRFNGSGWTHDRRAQIFSVPLPGQDGELSPATQLTSAEYGHGAITISHDGARIAYLAASQPDADLVGDGHILILDIDGGEPTQVTTELGQWSHLRFTPDDDALLAIGYTGSFRAVPSRLHRVDFDATVTCVDPDDVSRFDYFATPFPLQVFNNEAYVSALRRGAVHVDAIDLDSGESRVVVGGNRTVGAFAVAHSGDLFYSSGDETHPLELCSLVDGDEQQLTHLNADFLDEVELVQPEVVEIESSGGAMVEAWVSRPPASLGVEGDSPGLVYVHGGPMTQWGYRFFDEFQVAAAHGYVVIGGNPRGSDGYGSEWSSAIEGCIGTVDWDDVQAITQHLVHLAGVDGSRIGIGGGSYGGFMATWAIGHSDAYAAALSERAVNNWESFQGSSDIGPWFGEVYTGARHADDLERVRAAGPISCVAEISTPTLIIHSEEDWRCPIEQAEQLFVSLRLNGVDTEFVRFPGENHELSRTGLPSHRIERFQYIHDWYAKYLGGLTVSDLEKT